MNLLDYFFLAAVDTLKVNFELFRAMPANEHCQARIELKLTPQLPQGDSLERIGQVIQARLFVLGLPASGREDDKRFAVEIIVNAAYRVQPTSEHELTFELFNQHHTSLTRQLLPILERRATLALQELNLAHVRLPLDLAQAEPEKQSSVH